MLTGRSRDGRAGDRARQPPQRGGGRDQEHEDGGAQDDVPTVVMQDLAGRQRRHRSRGEDQKVVGGLGDGRVANALFWASACPARLPTVAVSVAVLTNVA